MTASDHEKWMRMALELARKGLGTTTPNPMVGAVIVRDGKVIGQGYHIRAGGPHAEIHALRSCEGEDLSGATLYVTLEPCSTYGRTPPCTKAILESGIRHVVIGSPDPNPKHAGRAVELLREQEITVEYPVLEQECLRLNEAFFKWIVTGRPFVLLKLAQTLDGKIATASGNSQWITGPEARAHVQQLRQWADAVLAGGETYRKDSPRFTVRDEQGKVLKTPRRFIATRSPEKYSAEGWEFINISDWDVFLERLGSENVTSLLIEGGGELAASALRAGAVDKVEFHIAPKILGGRACRPSVGGWNPETLQDALELEKATVEPCGKDFIFSAYLSGKKG